MARIICVSNQKGGVGKTTTAINVGAALAEGGSKVLLVDLDPRADLSGYLGIVPEGAGVYEALFDDGVHVADVVVQTDWFGLQVVPATIDLAAAEMLLVQRPARQRHGVVAEALGPVADSFDYVLLDSPPGLQLLAVAALAASAEVLVPQQCSFLALHGLRQLSQSIERIRADLRADLRICGIVMTMQDRRTVHNRQVIQMVREGFGDLVMDTVIPTTIRLQEAAAAGEPILTYEPHGTAAEAYRQLAKELIRRG
jgi:chromosome partitioning protein